MYSILTTNYHNAITSLSSVYQHWHRLCQLGVRRVTHMYVCVSYTHHRHLERYWPSKHLARPKHRREKINNYHSTIST